MPLPRPALAPRPTMPSSLYAVGSSVKNFFAASGLLPSASSMAVAGS